MKDADLRQIKARPLPQLLQDFVKHYESRDENATPALVRLNAGASFYTGTPIRLEKHGVESWVVLWSDVRGEAPALSLVAVSKIEGLTVLNPGAFVDLLTQGEKSLDVTDAPSRLGLEREAASLTHLLQTSVTGSGFAATFVLEWNGHDGDPAARAILGVVLAAMRDLFPTWAQDPLAQPSLKELQRITLSYRPEKSVLIEREGGLLKVSVGTGVRLKSLTSDLKSGIESKI